MYRIMLVKSKKDNDQSLFQFLTTTIDGVTSALDIADKEALDVRVESMLNNGYAKSDFIIVRVIDSIYIARSYKCVISCRHYIFAVSCHLTYVKQGRDSSVIQRDWPILPGFCLYRILLKELVLFL